MGHGEVVQVWWVDLVGVGILVFLDLVFLDLVCCTDMSDSGKSFVTASDAYSSFVVLNYVIFQSSYRSGLSQFHIFTCLICVAVLVRPANIMSYDESHTMLTNQSRVTPHVFLLRSPSQMSSV